MTLSKKNSRWLETLNPKKYKNCPTGSFNVNPSTGVNRVWKPGTRNLSFVKTKEDVDLAVDKAVESGLINFGKKSWCLKFKILSTIRN
jgi:hypothetical protein